MIRGGRGDALYKSTVDIDIDIDWKSSILLPVFKGKGDPMECASYRAIKLLEHAMKVTEHMFE